MVGDCIMVERYLTKLNDIETIEIHQKEWPKIFFLR